MDGRYAPSPTGTLHLGNLRTALLAWLFARSTGSRFVLRFEDLDPGPVRAEHYDSQRRDLAAIGIDWDEELRQRDHLDRYVDALSRLDRSGLLYRCYCTRRELAEAAAAPHGPSLEGGYPGTCRLLSSAEHRRLEREGRRSALRVSAGGDVVTVDDRQLGPLTGVVDDLVVQRADGVVAYNLAVVVDDAFQGVAEVVRGDDLAHVAPGQHWLGAKLGLAQATYAHVPLVLGPEGKRLAKRDGAVTLADREVLGEQPAAVRHRLLASVGLPGELDEACAMFEPLALPRSPLRLERCDLSHPSAGPANANPSVMSASAPPAAARVRPCSS